MLYFHETLVRLRVSAHEFFETAYVWRFDKQGYVTPDYCVYITDGVLPKYVVGYLLHLQGELK